ncbi:MAG: prepilin-type N-terminal cleavage/methylation domain-containing protein [Bradyrhizobium sp.]|nr:prepilin-type N-terminal cleavage/methylation domain-containing protein [Bradyrhizobium sp.]
MNAAPSKRVRGLADRRRGERGFALLEILVAFVVLALGLAAVLTGVSVAMRSDAKTQTSRSVLRVAQSRLEAAGVTEGLVPGHHEGRVGNYYTWRQTVTAVQSGAGSRKPEGVKPDGAKPEPATANAVSAFWVEVAVRAGDGTVARLAGLKLGPVAKP